MRPACTAAPPSPRQHTPQRFTVGLALQLQPTIMLAESNTLGNRLNS